MRRYVSVRRLAKGMRGLGNAVVLQRGPVKFIDISQGDTSVLMSRN